MCRAAAVLLVSLVSAAALPAPAAEPVAEAHFLCDPLPPGGRDLNASLLVARGEPDPATGAAGLAVSPRLQLAMALGERAGFTADVGLATDGALVTAPAASLKVLLRAPAPDRTGLSASLDLFGPTHALLETEAGLGVGALRAVGGVTLRAGASLASGVASWSPHLHGGGSAALALGRRWRVLGEAVFSAGGGRATLAAGPTVKLAVAERTAVVAGALFGVAGAPAAPTLGLQLTQAL